MNSRPPNLNSALIPDVQASPDERRIAIDRVGVRGLRYPLSPLFVAWTCFFLVRALKRQSRNDYMLAGLMLGIGLNGYSPFRVVVDFAREMDRKDKSGTSL